MVAQYDLFLHYGFAGYLRAQTAPQRDRSSAAFAHGAGSHMAEKADS